MSDRSPVCMECGAPLAPSYPSMICARCLWEGDEQEAESPEVAHPGMKSLHVPGHDVLEEIARGGMGVVYRARERETQRTVALKMLRPRLADEEGMRERFRLEASAVAGLEHPSILPVYRVDEADDMPFFTMKLAAGGTLAARREALRGQWREIATLILTLSEAVQYAHQRGVLHRDLKPANVLFDDADKAYLTDFGLVKLIDAVSELTGSQSFLGTPHYSSPEVASANAGAATVVSDVWSLGAMLYELLTGRLPFEAEGLMPLLRRIAEEPPAPFATPARGAEPVPKDLRVICLKCLQKNPADRYHSAGALASDLRAWLDGRPIAARAASFPERLAGWARRNPKLATMAAALVCSLALVAGLLWREYRASRQSAEESRAAEIASRKAEAAAQGAEAASLLEETRARLRDGQWVDRKQSIEAVLRSHALRPSAAARDVLLSLLALPELERTGEIPYTAGRPVFLNGDLSRYVTVEKDGTAIRETASGTVLFTIPEKSSSNFPPGPLSADGKRLILRSDSRNTIWEVETKRELAVLPLKTGFPAFSADGSRAAAGTGVADLRTNPATVITVDAAPYSSRDLSPDGKYLLLGHSEVSRMRLVDAGTGALVGEFEVAGANMIHCVAWSGDGASFYTGMVDGKIAKWSMNESSPDWVLPAHTDGVDSIALFDEGNHLITQARDGFSKIWDLRTLVAVATLPWPGLRVIASEDGRHLAIDNRLEKKTLLFRFTPPPVSTLVRLPPSRVPNSYFQGEAGVLPSDDNSGFAVTAGHDIHLLDREGKLQQSLRCGRCDGIAPDPLGKGFVRNQTAISRRQHTAIRCPLDWKASWDHPSLVLGTWDGFDGLLASQPLTRRLFVGVGERITAVDSTMGLKIQKSDVTPATLPPGGVLSATAFSPSGRLLAWAGIDKPGDEQRHIHVQDAAGKDTAVFDTAAGTTALAFTADEETVLAGDGQEIVCHEIATGRVRWRIPHQRLPQPEHREPVRIAVAATSGTVAAALTPETVSLIDPRTGQILRTFRHPTNRIIRAIGLSPDGARLVAVGSYIVYVWRLDSAEAELGRYGMAGPA